MKVFKKRFHDVVDKMNSAYQCAAFIRDSLENAKKKNKPIDTDKLVTLASEIIDNIDESAQELKTLKKIAYKLGDPDKDYDHLISDDK